MAQGIALTIGLNSVDPGNYAGWSGGLNVCEADAKDLTELVEMEGFQCKTLLTEKATRAGVSNAILHAAERLKAGDVFLLSYSGHGGHLPDLNRDEDDYQDETWCLYDGELVDDELYTLWGAFAAGVKIVLLSDSCHSGSVVERINYVEAGFSDKGGLARAMPDQVAFTVYRENKSMYDPILKSRDTEKSLCAVKASVMLISACRDDQLSYEGTFNGVFTGALKRVWDEGAFRGTYKQFHEQISASIRNGQTPMFSMVGVADPKFAARMPFSI